jgi:hypothetical protein
MKKKYNTPAERFRATYLPVEELVNDYVFEMEVVPNMSISGFYAYAELGKYTIGKMGGTNTYCDRGVHDAQILIAWLQYINDDIDSEFTEHIIICLTCFIFQALERRFRWQITVEDDLFVITAPDSERRLSHLDNVNFASLYRDQLIRSRDYLLRQLCTPFHHHRAYSSEALSEEFVATNEYFPLSSAWPDKVAAMDDYIVAVSPSLLDSNQMEMLAHVVAGVIKERSISADWEMCNGANHSQGTIPDQIHRAIKEQIIQPNQTAVFDLVKGLSVDFKPPSEVIGFEDAIFINPVDDVGEIRPRYQMFQRFDIPPHE